jgi:hypothetical protein
MTVSAELMRRDLQAHVEVCTELLTLASRENQTLRSDANLSVSLNDYWRKDLLSRLDKALDKLRRHRIAWQKLQPSEKARNPEISRLIRAAQEVAMKIIALDRENEQLLLRRGLVPPRQLAAHRQFQQELAASLYQRSSSQT